jgi:hypothetical protein
MIKINIEIGDTILTGKFKNKKIVVKSIGVDDHGMPTVNGKGITKIRKSKVKNEKYRRAISSVLDKMKK